MLQSGYFSNASGCWCTNETQINELFHTKLDAVITKTCTLFPMKGNPEPTFFKNDNAYVNSKGLPNEGYEYYKQLCETYFSMDKPIILSVAWEFEEKNTIYLLKDYDDFIGGLVRSRNSLGEKCREKVLVELNLSCPNLHRVIPSYHPQLLYKILTNIQMIGLKYVVFSLKLSPYLDHDLCDKIIDTINNTVKLTLDTDNVFKYVVLSNSIPNCLVLNNNVPVLSNIYGGLSGKLNKYISLSNVHYFRKKLNSCIKIIGCGGIETINDVNEYLTHGASFVQLGSCFYNPDNGNLDCVKINSLIDEFDANNSLDKSSMV